MVILRPNRIINLLVYLVLLVYVFLLVLFAVFGLKKCGILPRRDDYATHKSIMTQKRRQKKSKKTKKSQSDLSDNGSIDGSTAPLSYTARGRTHQGGSLGDLESNRALSPPVIESPVNQSLFSQSTSHQATNQVIQSPVNQALVNQAPVIQSPVNQASVNQAPVICIWLSNSVYSWLFTSQCASTNLCSFYKQPCISW